jgi:hypothetical protein
LTNRSACRGTNTRCTHSVGRFVLWFVGTPVYHVERDHWALYAYDTTIRPEVRLERGCLAASRRARDPVRIRRSPRHDLEVVHPTWVGAVREMARCLRDIGEGRVPT